MLFLTIEHLAVWTTLASWPSKVVEIPTISTAPQQKRPHDRFSRNTHIQNLLKMTPQMARYGVLDFHNGPMQRSQCTHATPKQTRWLQSNKMADTTNTPSLGCFLRMTINLAYLSFDLTKQWLISGICKIRFISNFEARLSNREIYSDGLFVSQSVKICFFDLPLSLYTQNE